MDPLTRGRGPRDRHGCIFGEDRSVASLLFRASILVLCANCNQGGVPAFVDPQDVDSGIRDDDPGFQFLLSATGVGVERTGYCCCIR